MNDNIYENINYKIILPALLLLIQQMCGTDIGRITVPALVTKRSCWIFLKQLF